ncbi:MAG: xanthine dehydrogenase accessory protein XdhC [Burkholderiaceae bacterium]
MQQLLRALGDGEQAVLVTVTQAQGSVPRDEGAWMAVLPSQLINTLGGGQLEFQAIQEARSLLDSSEALAEPMIKRYPLGPSLGQCCGGVVHLAFERVDVSNLSSLSKRLQTLEPSLALFGAGHVGQAIVALMEKQSWQVTWIDSREAIFPTVAGVNIQIEHSEPVQMAVQDIKANSHVLIMSFSHAEDLDVLQQCLIRQRAHRDLKSIGLIGSQTKWATFKSRLSQKGFEEADFLGVQCPIGIAGLRAKEPEIIAVSVVAQLLMNEEQFALAQHKL